MIAHPSISTPSAFLPPLQPAPDKGPAGEGWGEGSSSYTFSSPYDSVSASLNLSVSLPQDPGLKTQDSPSSPDLALWPFGNLAISPPAAAILESLVAAPSITTYAKAHGLSLTTLALWLQQPDIAEAHAALLELKALDRRAHHDHLADEALEVLRETMHAAEDPIERRRCANTILRAIARTNRPASGPLSRPRRERDGERAPSSTSSTPTPPSNPSASDSPSAISPPSSLSRCLAPSLPTPTPTPSETITADPESLTDLAAARLAALPDPTGERLYLAIYNLIDLDLRMGPRTWDPFKRTLEASPFVTCRPTDDQPWTRTDHPVEHQGETATRRYTFTHPDGRTTNCTLALATRGPSHYNATHWWITHLNTPNTPNTS